MDLIEIYVNTRSWVDSAQDRDSWRALVNAECSPPGYISYGVKFVFL